jgi:hypothetical protein
MDISVHGMSKGVRGMTDTSADATIIKTEVLGSLARNSPQRRKFTQGLRELSRGSTCSPN